MWGWGRSHLFVALKCCQFRENQTKHGVRGELPGYWLSARSLSNEIPQEVLRAETHTQGTPRVAVVFPLAAARSEGRAASFSFRHPNRILAAANIWLCLQCGFAVLLHRHVQSRQPEGFGAAHRGRQGLRRVGGCDHTGQVHSHTQPLTPATCAGGDSDVLNVFLNVPRMSLCIVRTTRHAKDDGEEIENVLLYDYFLLWHYFNYCWLTSSLHADWLGPENAWKATVLDISGCIQRYKHSTYFATIFLGQEAADVLDTFVWPLKLWQQ